jgi:hypothetical protein
MIPTPLLRNCGNCGFASPTALRRERCGACYQWRARRRRQRGVSWELAPDRPRDAPRPRCLRCRLPIRKDGRQRGRCRACAQYQRRTGRPRPMALIHEAAWRRMAGCIPDGR